MDSLFGRYRRAGAICPGVREVEFRGQQQGGACRRDASRLSDRDGAAARACGDERGASSTTEANASPDSASTAGRLAFQSMRNLRMPRTAVMEFCGLCGHTPAVSAGTAFERRFIGCMVAKSLILLTLCNFTHLRMKVSGAA